MDNDLSSAAPDSAWAAYLADFHRVRPGITQDVLEHATDGSSTPYAWLVEPVAGTEGLVLDVACGSGPLAMLVGGATWAGLDVSAAELQRAKAAGVTRVVQADATMLPVRSGGAVAVVCSMALMIIEPLTDAVEEAARLLQPGGLFAALVPAEGPLTIADRFRYAQLLWQLRTRRLDYPNRQALLRPVDMFASHGFALISDERRRFRYPLVGTGGAGALASSLYLPGTRPERIAAAVRTARGWHGRDIGIPLRRLVARREPTGGVGELRARGGLDR